MNMRIEKRNVGYQLRRELESESKRRKKKE